MISIKKLIDNYYNPENHDKVSVSVDAYAILIEELNHNVLVPLNKYNKIPLKVNPNQKAYIKCMRSRKN